MSALVRFFSFVFIVILPISATLANEPRVRIVTEIEGDPFSGIKSDHSFYWKSERSTVTTGTTDLKFPGDVVIKFTSVRNNFRAYRNRHGVFIKGSTKSGITGGIGPGIDYSFQFKGEAKNARVIGCHDGYPSYRIYVGEKLIYYYKHSRYNLIKLFGRCDIKIDKSFKY